MSEFPVVCSQQLLHSLTVSSTAVVDYWLTVALQQSSAVRLVPPTTYLEAASTSLPLVHQLPTLRSLLLSVIHQSLFGRPSLPHHFQDVAD
jgi:hypothetical protein